MTQKETILLRAQVKAAIANFFSERGYLEVETPRLVASPDIEPTLTHFDTQLNVLGGGPYHAALITSPEYALKKLVSPELPRIFEWARVFRNAEPLDARHNPEFTLLEWYRLGASFEEGIEETIALVEAVAQSVNGTSSVVYGGRTFSTERSDWQMVTVQELFREYCNIDTLQAPTRELYESALQALDISFATDDTISDLFQRLFLNKVQPVIDASPAPVVVTGYPAHEATLAELDERGFARRFEIYIGGLELCNAYGELTDAQEQRKRFEAEVKERVRLGKQTYPIDEELLLALERVDQPLFGNALGIERLMMLVSGGSSIQDMLTFSAKDLFQGER